MCASDSHEEEKEEQQQLLLVIKRWQVSLLYLSKDEEIKIVVNKN